MTLASRLTIAMVAMVLLTATAVGLLNYRSVAQSALPRALDRIDAHARVIAVVLKSAVGSARADVVGFRYSNDVIDIMTTHLERDTESSAGAAEAEWRRRLAQRFVAELTAKANYAQLRLIGVDDGGRELVRVDRSGPDGAIRIVPDSELLRKADRDYFKHAILLPADEIYISPIDLHRKNGIVEIPPIPTLRAAAPIYTPTGKPFGIVIINVDLREAFSHVRSTTRTDAKVYLVNERGDYLVNPDQSRAFGFEFGTPFLIQDNFPTIAGLLTGSATEPSVVRDRAGGYFGVALNSQILAGGPLVTVVETLPYSISHGGCEHGSRLQPHRRPRRYSGCDSHRHCIGSLSDQSACPHDEDDRGLFARSVDSRARWRRPRDPSIGHGIRRHGRRVKAEGSRA